MRIFVLAHRVPYPPDKGEKIRTYHQIEYLCAHGHRVDVYAVQHEEQDRMQASALATKLGVDVFLYATRFRRLRLLLGLFGTRTLSVCNFREERLQRRFDADVAQDLPDAVLCTGSAMASYVFANPRLGKEATEKPTLIMDFMDLDSDKWRQYASFGRFPMSWIYRRECWLLSRYEKKINSHFSSSIFVTRNEADLFLTRQPDRPERVRVVGNGVDTTTFRPVDARPRSSRDSTPGEAAPSGRRSPDIVFVGVMDYLPNEDAVSWFIEESWSRLRERWPRARFTIAGTSPSERVNRLGRFSGIEVTGRVDSVLPYLHRANVFVAPFRIARGLQNKILQAFATGVPVVTSASGAEGVHCRDGEHLLIAETSEEYLHAIERLMDEPELYESIRRNALALAREHYSWEGRNRALQCCLPKETVE